MAGKKKQIVYDVPSVKQLYKRYQVQESPEKLQATSKLQALNEEFTSLKALAKELQQAYDEIIQAHSHKVKK